MAVLYGKNYGKPTLDLNFAGNKSLVDTTTEKNYVTFSRAQSGNEATYIGSDGLIKYAAADEARFDHDPVTGECLGLLVEESRTNLYETSEDYGPWTKSATYWSITANSTTAPDGTNTATKCIPNAGIGNQSIYNITVLTDGVTYSGSIFFKAAELTKVCLRSATQSNSPGVLVDLTAGTAVWNSCNGTIQPLSNGWYRVTMTWTQSGTVAAGKSGFGVNSLSGETFDGVNGFYAWGSQLEAGAFPTSYIPTSGSTVTRSVDVANITGTNFSSWYNQSEGTILTSVRTLIPKEVSNGFFVFTDGTSSNRIEFRQSGSGDPFPRAQGLYRYLNSTTTQFLNQEEGWSTDGKDLDNWCLAFDNMGYTFKTKYDFTPATGTGSYPQNLNNLSIMHKGTISRLTYYPKRLPDIELQQLTK